MTLGTWSFVVAGNGSLYLLHGYPSQRHDGQPKMFIYIARTGVFVGILLEFPFKFARVSPNGLT